MLLLSISSLSVFAQDDLIISGVIDGPLTGGTPKAVELYAINDITDLSVYGIGSANNGGGSDMVEFQLTGSATAGDFLYLASEEPQFEAFFGFKPNFADGAASINGDDAIELFYNEAGVTVGNAETVVDLFGDINVDGNGTPWEYLDGWAYRKNGAMGSTTFDVQDWKFSGVDALDGAASNSAAGSAFPIGKYKTEADSETGTDFAFQITSENDAVEESLTDNSMYMNSSDLELGSEPDGTVPQRVGLRFTGIALPANAVINSAYIQFTVDAGDVGNNEDPTEQTIYIEDVVNSAAFTAEAANLTSRAEAASALAWNVPTWTADELAGDPQKTPDVSVLISSILAKEGWEAGNAISFFFEGSGRRTAVAQGDGAPKLVINATIPPSPPAVAKEIEDLSTRPGWSFSLNLANYFIDIDSELEFEVTGLMDEELPVGVMLNGAELSGAFDKPGYYTMKAIAKEKGVDAPQMVAQTFGIVVKPEANRFIQPLSTVKLGTFDEGAAEISAFDPASERLFVTNAESNRIDIIDMSDPSSLALIATNIDITNYGGGVNSVAFKNGLLVAAIEANNKQDAGKVVAFDKDGVFQWEVTAGALPDMATFNEDGTKIIVANEGEPSDDYTNDPEGSISIITVSDQSVTHINFQSYNGQEATLRAEGVRIFGPNASVAQDLEPEYITVVGDSAYITLQENNALAIVDINTEVLKDIKGLGYKDHMTAGNGLDVPETDEIYISNWPFKGIYMPDAIAGMKIDGETYLFTANEGDTRDYDGYSEEIDLADIVLDETVFTNASDIVKYAGGLLTTTGQADTTSDGKYKTIYSIGARSFSIWNQDGDQVFDSGDDLEQITAAAYPENFNASNTNFRFKNRSDDKGPEPESITLGMIGNQTYLFVGLERIGGIMVYDVTDPASPQFIEYFNNRNFSAAGADADDALDSGPEGLIFIPSSESPNGENLLVVSNEISGTVTIYSVGEAADQNPFTLAIFHNNDGESALLADTVEIDGKKKAFGSIGQFKNTLDSLRDQATTRGYESIMLSSGDNFLPGQTFNASNANGVYYDAIALDSIGYDALCIGNHDFDFGTTVLADFIQSYQTTSPPYLTSNLGFSEVPEMQALVDAGRVAPITVIERNGEQIGVVGLTTPEITIISSPGKTEVSEALVDSVQKSVDALIADGINKIILISHLQGLEEDQEFVKEIENIDIIIAGGGDELLSNDPSIGEAFKLEPKGKYPTVVQDKNGEDVYLVTSPGNYRFIGNLLVDFDAEGKVTEVYQTNPVLVQGKANQDLVDNVEKPIRDYIKDLVSNIIAESEVDLDFRKPSLRTGETNGGNLMADAMLWQARETYDQFGVGVPDVALQNGGGLRIEKTIEKGDFNENLTYEICAFTNILSVVERISPARFKELMEWGVAEAPVSNGRFPQIAGFKMTYDQGLPAGERVLSITLVKEDESEVKIIENGAVVDGAPNVNMATIDFLAKGGDGYPFGDDLGFTVMGNTYQQALLNYITAENGLDSMITAAQYPEGMNERMFVETSPLVPVEVVFEAFDSNCPNMPEGWVEWNDGEDLISCGGGANSYIDFNGYAVGAGTSYLITPRIAVNDGDYVLSFDYIHQFGGPVPQVLYSNDFLGYGDPTTATWTVLQEATDSIAQQPEGGEFAHVEVNLTGIDAAASFAFKYASEGGSGGESVRFRIDNLIVTEPQAEALTTVSENFDIDEDILTDWFVFNEDINLLSINTDGYLDFNGYGVGAGATWLTSPVLATSAGDYMMYLDMVKRFGGPDVQVLFSSDYPGFGDPRWYEWEEMEVATESINDVDLSSNDFIGTGRLPLFDLEADGVIAIRYESEGPNGGESLRFRIDSIAFAPNNLPTAVAEIEDIELSKGGSVSVDLSTYFEDSDNDLIFAATDLRGDELPAGLTFTDNVISGTIDNYGYYNVIAIAIEDGDFAEDEEPGVAYQYFRIIVKPEAPTLMEQMGTVSLGTFGEGAAEISAYDHETKNLYVTNAELGRIDIVNISDPANPSPDANGIAIDSYGAGVNSVAFKNGVLVAAIEAETKTDNGKVVAFDATGNYLWDVTAGALPDMVAFNEDGTKVIVANEGEPNDDYSIDPEGTVSIINVADQAVTTVGFTSLNGMQASLEADGVRIFGPNATVAQDLEPEYVTVMGDSAFVSLQENNAIAIIDINTGELKSVKGLGYKDHSVAGNGIDAEGIDDDIYISTWPVKGIYQPDAIASYTVNGERYLLTANEGDAREYIVETDEATCATLGGDYDAEDGECLVYTDETEIGDEMLDETVFGDDLEDIYEYLGGLKISAPYSDIDNDGDFDEIYVYGTRSFSIWSDDGSQVYDSKDEFEQITAAVNPEYFNSSDDEYEFKNRSDNKGPEPEAITVGTVGDKTYAFIGLERQGGVMVYDVTDPTTPEFVEYMNNRDFEVDIESAASGDHAPEGLVFVPASESPINANLVIVSNEVSGTVTIYTVGGRGAELSAELADVTENEGFGSVEIDLSPSFTDPDDDALTFSAESADEAVVTVSVSGNTLTITEVGNGSSEITVTANDGVGISVSDMFSFTVMEVVPLGTEHQGLIVYPNPVDRELTIRSDISSQFIRAKVYAVNGQLVINTRISDQKTIKMGDLKTGVYMLHLIDVVGSTSILKVVKQ